MRSVPHGRRGGFSLVELVAVLAIATVLLTLAVPSYRQLQVRAHRVDAIARLLQAASCQESLRAAQGAYDQRRCLPALRDRYRFSYVDTDALAFTVRAEPRGPQSGDACGMLTLNHRGRRAVSADEADPLHCWSGR